PGWADLELRGCVPLAEHGSGVAVASQDLGRQGAAPWDDTGIAGVPGAVFDNDAGADGMVVAAGKECRSSRRAERGRVELVVLEPVVSKLVHVRSGNRSAEGTAHAEAHVIQQDEKDVRAALGSFHRSGVARGRVLVRLADLRSEPGVGLGKPAPRRPWFGLNLG